MKSPKNLRDGKDRGQESNEWHADASGGQLSKTALIERRVFLGDVGGLSSYQSGGGVLGICPDRTDRLAACRTELFAA